MNTVDTIAAVATAPGGAINIVRISGDNALAAAQQVWHGKSTLGKRNARKMLYGLIGDPGEPSLAVYMPKPNSYTGEDIVELHCHGGNDQSRQANQRPQSVNSAQKTVDER